MNISNFYNILCMKDFYNFAKLIILLILFYIGLSIIIIPFIDIEYKIYRLISFVYFSIVNISLLPSYIYFFRKRTKSYFLPYLLLIIVFIILYLQFIR